MANQRVKKSSSWTPQPQAKSSQFTSPPTPAQAKAPTPQDIENQAFMENKHEALGLQLQAKYDTITPQGQERLTLLQASMDTFRRDRLKSLPEHSLLDIPNLFAPRETPQPIQPALKIGKVGDKYEQEADQVAAQVVNQINAPVNQHKSQGETLQPKQMSALEDKGALMRKPQVQPLSGAGGMATTPDLEASIQGARGSGHSLADKIRQPMEKAFGADFSGVKIHTDAQSDQLNQSIQAKAFTTGQDIFFRQGTYDPDNRGGQELIAHELTHVIQQNGGAVQRQLDEQLPVTVTEAPTADVQRVLDDEQEAKLRQVAERFAQSIKDKKQQANYKKDKIKYIKTKLKSGDAVEEVGSSRVQSQYNSDGLNVWSSMHLEFQDASGKKVGGEQAELDFFIFKEDGEALPKVVSAKLDGKKVHKPTDRKLLRHYYELNITGSHDDLVTDLKQRFGGSPAYAAVTQVVVRYINNADGSQGSILLEEFRSRVPQPPKGIADVEVRGLAPDDTATQQGVDYIKLGIDQAPLLQRVTEIIDENLGIQ